MLTAAARALVLVALLTPPYAAGVKYAVHTEVRQGAGGQDPMSQMMSQMMAGQIAQTFPPGGIDQTIMITEKGTRTEQKQAAAGLPAGVIMLTRIDGAMLGIDPTAKTWWKQPSAADAAAQMAQLGIKTDVQTKKTGEFETIAGMKAEKVTMTMSMTIPGVDPSMMPMSFAVDLWMTDAVKSPAAASMMGSSMLAKMGVGDLSKLKDLNDGRFVVKQVMNLFGTEIVTTVKDVTKEDLADALFDVPKEFKEVAAPGGGGLLAAPRPGR